jgi:uncharacterized protein YndB with AHSA1/START domain
MNVLLKPTHHELTVTRDIRAPRERVFAAWTDPRQASIWWAPQDCTPLTCEMDVRPGGAWRRTMRVADGSVVTKHGIYRAVARPEILSFTYTTEYASGEVDPITLVTVTLEEIAGGTRVTLRHVNFETQVSSDSHKGGWTSALQRFAAFIAGQP